MIRNFLYSRLSNISELLLDNMASRHFVVKKEPDFHGSLSEGSTSDSSTEAGLGGEKIICI